MLFIDEIHRFSKAQQDALLHAVEDGIVTLIGASTENPYFEVIPALISRCELYQFQPLAQRGHPRRCSGRERSCAAGAATGGPTAARSVVDDAVPRPDRRSGLWVTPGAPTRILERALVLAGPRA